MTRKLSEAVWKTIDTAPKDGRWILIARPEWSTIPKAKWGAIYGEDGPFGGWLFEDENLCHGVDNGCLGWNEDIADGYMPTLWTEAPE